MVDTADRVSLLAGAIAPVLTLGAIFLATLLSPTFSWTGNALSNLGTAASPAATAATRLVFNGGLVAGALVGSGFGYALFQVARNRVELAGVAVFGLALVAMGLVGVFPQGTPLHVPVAVAFFGLLSCGLWTYGYGNLIAGDRARGLATIGAGVLNSGSWTIWVLTGDLLRPGLALPEIVGSVAFGAWALATVVDVRARLAG